MSHLVRCWAMLFGFTGLCLKSSPLYHLGHYLLSIFVYFILFTLCHFIWIPAFVRNWMWFECEIYAPYSFFRKLHQWKKWHSWHEHYNATLHLSVMMQNDDFELFINVRYMCLLYRWCRVQKEISETAVCFPSFYSSASKQTNVKQEMQSKSKRRFRCVRCIHYFNSLIKWQQPWLCVWFLFILFLFNHQW